MIFGFNTDVKHGDTIYHVQSEARESELLLQTQVFVRGRCIGKKATSYAATAAEAQFGDARRSNSSASSIARCWTRSAKASWTTFSTIRNRSPGRGERTGRAMAECRLGSCQPQPYHAVARHRRRLGRAGARLTFRFARPGAAPFYTQAVTDSGGGAEIKIEVEEAALPDSSVLVQANYEGRTATRKFALRKAD